MTKPASVEQPILIGIVLQFVQQFVPEFSAADITWVRAMKSSKFGVLNCQCRTVMMASKVRSTFASLVKSKPTPGFIGKVFFSWILLWLIKVVNLYFHFWLVAFFLMIRFYCDPVLIACLFDSRCQSLSFNKSGLEFDCLSCAQSPRGRRIMIPMLFAQSQLSLPGLCSGKLHNCVCETHRNWILRCIF